VRLGGKAAFLEALRISGLGWSVQTTLVAEPVVAVASKRKSSLLPLLVVLFLISYGLLTLLVVEQDHTITAQKTLISQLYGDSLELTAMKSKEIQRHRMDAQTQSQAQGQMHSKARVEAQTPAPQQKPQAKIEADSSKVGRRFLQKPKGVEDNPDARRALGKG
jgi:hypothetical protein